ncbi:hypothetical protein L1987_39840 [Smallanthus sonchifolius]|uniref:Uncharacterized protein n=1 Tax=Smallanthus sonchifolius TaxID=185202 RepID=A0ACB9GS64_9ASTR|nr:hypothetical protein L1987_39840 [Smallanthus sonchifolius]
MDFFSGTYSTEEADFMSLLFGSFSTKLPNVSTFQDSSAFWPHHDELSTSNKTNANLQPIFSQENSCTDGDNVIFPTSSGESYLSISCSSGSQKGGVSVIPFTPAAEYNNMSANARKHSFDEVDVHMSWKKPKRSKCQKLVSKVNTDGVDRDVARLNTNGKRRASPGSAIDSQSAYAKKRRERINERLRILQNLVPNGTKLLSSDDLWMYAPIAYNGLDLGLDKKLPSPR